QCAAHALPHLAVAPAPPARSDHALPYFDTPLHDNTVVIGVAQDNAAQSCSLSASLFVYYEQGVLIGLFPGPEDRIQRNERQSIDFRSRDQSERRDHPDFKQSLWIPDRHFNLEEPSLLIC